MSTSIKERRKSRLVAKLVSLDEFWEQEKDHYFKDVRASITLKSHGSSALEQNFQEVLDFFAENKRVPSEAAPDLEEKLLARKLVSISKQKDDPKLKSMDVYGLLSSNISNKPEIDLDDEAALLQLIDTKLGDDLTKSIITPSGLTSKQKNRREDSAKRSPCSSFFQYLPIFTDVRRLIDEGMASITPFRDYANKIAIGDVFFWDGLTCLVAEEVKMEFDPKGKPNPRLRVIFDNGTYADLLMQSLSQGMYRSHNTRRLKQNMSEKLASISNTLEEKYGQKTGEIYFLSSTSTAESVKQFKNLLKIGVTTRNTPNRIRNAEMEATYLFAPVKVLRILPCYNMNVENLESMIHAELHAYRKSIRLTHRQSNKIVEATEWFDVPLQVALDTALEIVKKSHPNYQMDKHHNIYS